MWVESAIQLQKTSFAGAVVGFLFGFPPPFKYKTMEPRVEILVLLSQ